MMNTEVILLIILFYVKKIVKYIIHGIFLYRIY